MVTEPLTKTMLVRLLQVSPNSRVALIRITTGCRMLKINVRPYQASASSMVVLTATMMAFRMLRTNALVLQVLPAIRVARYRIQIMTALMMSQTNARLLLE
jgi:hypothetical protein